MRSAGERSRRSPRHAGHGGSHFIQSKLRPFGIKKIEGKCHDQAFINRLDPHPSGNRRAVPTIRVKVESSSMTTATLMRDIAFDRGVMISQAIVGHPRRYRADAR